MQYKWFLDSVQVDDPKGWDSLITSVTRDRVLRGLLKKQEGTFDFAGNGFDLLFDRFKTESFTAIVPILVQQSLQGGGYTDFIIGNILLSDVEFDLKLKTAKAKIYDNSYQAKISTNKNIGAFLYTSRSKLNKTIAPITPVQLSFFKPSDGSYYSITNTGGYENFTFRVYDVLRYLIDFMTDGSVKFTSDDFGVGGQYYNYFITTGRILELVDSSQVDWPGVNQQQWENYWNKVAYADMFKEIDHRFNLGFQIENIVTPTVRIESNGYFSTPTEIISFPAVDELKIKTLTDYLYSKVMFGQGETDDGAAWSFPEQIPYIGFRTEEFQTVLLSPVDKALDLTTNFISSSNVIERLIIDGLLNDRDNDNKIFIIQGESDGAGGFKASQSNPFTGSAPFYYNQSLINSEIAQRFFNGVPSSIATFLNTQNLSFQAQVSATSGLTQNYQSNISVVIDTEYEPLLFDDDYNRGFDPTNSYGNGTTQGTPVSQANSRFTITTGGIYSLFAKRNVSVSLFLQYNNSAFTNAIFDNIYVFIRIKHYDSADTFINQSDGARVKIISNSTPSQAINSPGSYFPTVTGTFNTNSGDYFQVALVVEYVPNTYNTGTKFEFYRNNIGSEFSTSKTITGGGVYQVYDPANYSVILIESSVPVTEEQFNEILKDPRGRIGLGRAREEVYMGNIESIKFPHQKGEAAILLNSSQNNNF